MRYYQQQQGIELTLTIYVSSCTHPMNAILSKQQHDYDCLRSSVTHVYGYALF